MTDLAKDLGPKLLGTAGVAARCGVTRDTVWDWIVRGVLGRGGVRVRLDARKHGGAYKVTPAQLDAFLGACDTRPEGGPTAPTPTAADRQAAADMRRARQALASLGEG
jgi:hypothetical protein